MNKKVYELLEDVQRLDRLDRPNDIEHDPFPDQEKATYIWNGSVKGHIPDPIYAYGNVNELLSEYDCPVFSLGLPVVSKKLLNVLLSVSGFEYKTSQILLVDSTYKDALYGKENKNLEDISINKDYCIFDVKNKLKIFDFEKSIYKRRKSDPSRPYLIDKLVFKEPTNGFPVIFRSVETTGLFISQETKDAMDKANIKGLCLKEIEVS